MEREFIRERTREALRGVKAQGRRLGRPRKVGEATLREALRYIERGYTLKDTAKPLGVGYTTLAKAVTQNPTYRAQYHAIKGRLRAK